MGDLKSAVRALKAAPMWALLRQRARAFDGAAAWSTARVTRLR